MVCSQVIGNHTAITISGAQGHFEVICFSSANQSFELLMLIFHINFRYSVECFQTCND
jgi:fumarate hydratase class II